MSSQQRSGKEGEKNDRFYNRLFTNGHFFPALSDDLREMALAMEKAGVVELKMTPYVKCVNFRDKDIRYAHKRHCRGFLPFSPLKGYDDRRFHCPECGREIFPYGKEGFTGWRVVLSPEAAIKTVEAKCASIGCVVKTLAPGVIRAELDGHETYICFWDFCGDVKYKSPSAQAHFNIVYIYATTESCAGGLTPPPKSFWLKDIILGGDGILRSIISGDGAQMVTDVGINEVMSFNQRERVSPKPSYSFNKKAGLRMMHDIVVTPKAILIDGLEAISMRNSVSYGIFVFFAEVFIEDQRSGKKREEYRAVPVQKIRLNGKEYDDSTSMRRNINRLRKELSTKLSEEFKVAFDDDEIIENPAGQTGYRLNPSRVTVCMEMPESE